MHGHAGNLNAARIDAVINQLPARFFAGNEIETNIVASPALPETIVRIGDYRDERNSICQS
jgi:hypothetical protein